MEGLFAGQQDPKGARNCLVAFSSSLLIGVITGTYLPESRFIFYLSIFSLIITGGIVTIQLKPSMFWVIIIAVLLGLIQGLANGSALGNGIRVINYVSGVTAVGVVLVTIFSGLGLTLVKSWQKIAIRVAGSWIAAVGIIYLPFLIMNIKLN
jgi:hydrogenase/urease accessory protein HupE